MSTEMVVNVSPRETRAATPRGGVKLEMSRRRAQAFRERMSL